MFTDDLKFDASVIAPWFPHEPGKPYTLVRVSEASAKTWAAQLGLPIRRCYVNDELIRDRAKAVGVTEAEIIASKLPDPGATMAGDFGEILVYMYHAAKGLPDSLVGPKKWRLKQDRTKPAPLSDVVQFVLPGWPAATTNDAVYCSEVKTKSKKGESTPIASAIEDCQKDRTSRLARTLVWLRERALGETLGDIQVAHLNRFINATEHPPAKKGFRAVAVICSSLVEEELKTAPAHTSAEYDLVIISVPGLYDVYSSAFESAMKALPQPVHASGNSK